MFHLKWTSTATLTSHSKFREHERGVEILQELEHCETVVTLCLLDSKDQCNRELTASEAPAQDLANQHFSIDAGRVWEPPLPADAY